MSWHMKQGKTFYLLLAMCIILHIKQVKVARYTFLKIEEFQSWAGYEFLDN